MSDEIPAGWGTAPKRSAPREGPTARSVTTGTGELHQHRPDAFVHASDDMRAIALTFALNDVRLQLHLFEASGDEAHLWRAWRTARTFGDIPAELLVLLVPKIDSLAYDDAKSQKRAQDREDRNYILFNYHNELRLKQEKRPGAAKSVAECYERVAARTGTTPGAVKQVVLKYEGRGQRGASKR